MARSVKLTFYEAQLEEAANYGIFRLRVVAHDPVGMEADVFVCLREPANHKTGELKDVFQNVASPVDMEEYPIGAPTTGETEFPFFRVAEVELDFRSTYDYQTALTDIREQVSVLISGLNRLDLMKETSTLTVGEEGSSESL